MPFDWDGIAALVKRTSRVVIAHEEQLTAGFGAELAARIAGELFEYLDAPVRRVAALDSPVAYAPDLEEVILPQSSDVLAAIRDTAAILSPAEGRAMDRRSFLAACAAPALPALQRALPPRQGRAAQPPSAPGRRVRTLRSVGGLPADIAGAFRDPMAFERAASGQYFVFDRPGHAVYGVDGAMTGAWKIVQIGQEAGRIIEPSAFALAQNGTFAVADRPGALERIQFFDPAGNLTGGFTLPGRAAETVSIGGLVLNGVGSLQYDGHSVFVSQPETGALVAQYSPNGVPLRTFGTLRRTGHEADRDLHFALNAGLPLADPTGGFVFVFQTGIPLLRKLDATGALLFERHVEGREIDPVLQAMPTTWPRRAAGGRELPLVPPIVRAARVDASGRVWVSFTGVPFTYVYDRAGEKVAVVQFRAAGIVQPASLFFSQSGRLLVTPGCYEFDPTL